MTDIIASILSGGATGLIGSALSSVMDFFKLKQQHAHDLEMGKLEQETLKLETARDVTIAKEEAETKKQVSEDEADAKAQVASYGQDSRQYLSSEAVKSSKFATVLMAIVDFCRGMVRPTMVVYLCVATTVQGVFIYLELQNSGVMLSQEQLYNLIMMYVTGVFYMTFTAVGWYFGSRSKFDKMMNKMKL